MGGLGVEQQDTTAASSRCTTSKTGAHEFSEIALLLGFYDQAGMNRAFERWTGTLPKKYAASLAGA